MKLPNPCFAILSPIMCDFPSEELRNEGKRFLWGGPTVPPFFVGDKRPVGLPDIGRGMEIQQGTPPSFVSLFDPVTNTPFYSAYKVLPGQAKKHWHKTEAQKSKMDGSSRYINGYLTDRLEDNQSIEHIQRLGVYTALLQNTQRH